MAMRGKDNAIGRQMKPRRGDASRPARRCAIIAAMSRQPAPATPLSAPPVRAILLDYGGVIAEEGFQNGLRELAAEQGLDVDAIVRQAGDAIYASGFVTGQGTAHDFWQRMREETGLRGSDAGLTRRILAGFKLRPWMLDLVRQWREQGHVTGILSDQTHWLDWLDERDHFFACFDHVFNSYHLGLGKRDPALYGEIAARLCLSPGEILFVDDTRTHVERARAAGWRAIHYVDQADFLARIGAELECPGSSSRSPIT